MTKRFTGTKNISPSGNQTISAPNGGVIIATSSTGGTYVGPQNYAAGVNNNSSGVVNFVVSYSHNVGNNITPNGPQGSDPTSIDQGQYFSTTAERQLAGSYFSGGVGIEKDLSVGGFIYGRIAQSNSATTSSQIIVLQSNNDQYYYPTFTDSLRTAGTNLYGDDQSNFASQGLRYNPYEGKLVLDRIGVAATETSVSSVSGAFTVTGGVGIGKDVYVGGNVMPGTANTSTIGDENLAWASAYLNNVYTRFVGNESGNITMSPNAGVSSPRHGTGGLVDVFGDIRVRGNNPVGTAPVVTNVLYVTMDGDDTNDGRAMDASRACRTIGGALKSPFYQPGTQIRVAPGHYLENNPLQLKPYTSIMGSDLRTTGVEPINKTQDLFHLNSGCYLAFMQFLNGRSGLLPGIGYTAGTNRGAYATAFPPLTGTDRIDLFHSPYIQNCTNLTGPWLADGTMFVPDETVQVPLAVGMGTWEANQTKITVTVENEPINGFINAGVLDSYSTEYTGDLQNTITRLGEINTANDLKQKTANTLLTGWVTKDTNELWVYTGAKNIEVGMSINAGQQNQGFFNGRSLLLANKQFLQSQVVAFIENTFNSGSFNYDSVKCYRDTGLIVDAIATDMLYGTTSDSTFSGLQYYTQGNYTGQIPAEITTTTAAISYLSGLAVNIANQAGDGTVATTVQTLFNTILDILQNGTANVTENIIPLSLPSNDPIVKAAYQALQDNKAKFQDEVIAYITTTYPLFDYNTATCARDIGYIIDSVSFDLLHAGNLQSIKSGVYYYSYTSDFTTSNFSQEIPQTTAAYNYIKSIIPLIVTGQQLPSPYQTTVSQTIANYTPGTSHEVTTLQNNIDVITNIIRNGPTHLINTPDAVPNPGVFVAASGILNANKAFIQNEVIQFLTNTIPPGFTYDEGLCFRDVGLIVDCIVKDLIAGGYTQTVKAGNSYNNVAKVKKDQITETLSAINYINTIAQALLTNSPYSPLQANVGPVIEGFAAEIKAPAVVADAINVITGIIVNGPGIAVAKIPQELTINQNAEVLNAYKLLEANRNFIQEEVIAYIDSQFNNFTYNRQLSYRDSGILVENIAYDAAFGGNEKSVESGLAYWNGVVSVISGQQTQCISAIDYLSSLAQKVVANEPCPVLTVPDGVPTGTQIINTAMMGGEIIIPSIKQLFNIVTDVIENGPSVAPASYNSTGPDAAYVSAEILMQANRKFIQEDVINWINNAFQTFPYSQIKCKRDTGIIIDSIVADLLYPTPTFSQSTFAGIQYWNQGSYVGQIPTEINQTIDAVKYLRDLSVKVIQNITTATDALVGITRYSTGVQTTASNYASSAEVSAIKTYFNNVISIMGGNVTGWTDQIEANGAPSNLASVQNTYALLQENKSYLAQEVVAFVNATNPGFVYSTSTCYRDVGYIIDSISFDLLHGGNRQSIQAGFCYYGFTNTNTVIHGQLSQTVDAFNFLGTLTAAIVQGQPVTPLQTKVRRNASLPNGDAISAATLQQAISTLTNIITNGIGVVSALTPISLVPNTSSLAKNAAALVEANKEFLVAETIAYINKTYNSTPFTYNTATCQRDTGLIIDGIGIDLLYNSISESTFTGLQYWNQNGYTGRISSEISTTTAAIVYLNSRVDYYLPQNASNKSGNVDALFTIITNILSNGTAGVTDLIESNGLPSNDPITVLAYQGIQSNKATIQQEVVDYVRGTLGFTNFNADTCYRDAGYIIDSVCFDLLHGGNKQSIKSAVYYYNFSNATAIPNEIPETSAAYEFIASIIPSIVTGQLVTTSFQSAVSQVTNLPPGTPAEAGVLQDKINIIVNIINNGPQAAGDKTPISLRMDSTPAVKNAYNLLAANRAFIVAEVIAFIDATFEGPQSFNYNQELCYRDTGLIIDAVTQDVLLGGNQKSIEAGLAYWNQGYNYVTGQETTTTVAINHARDISLEIISNRPVVAQKGNTSAQIINPFFQYGDNYMPQQAVRRNFDIITNIIINGPSAAPPSYAGGGIFALTGIAGFDVKLSPQVISVDSYADYDETLCRRDSGYIIDGVSFDVALGTNYNAVTSGNAYQRGVSSVVVNKELPGTTAAINFLKDGSMELMASESSTAVNRAASSYDEIINILNGAPPSTITFTDPIGVPASRIAAKDQLIANKTFIQSETVAWIQTQIAGGVNPFINFVYNPDTCARDVGYIVDALCYDILYGGNTASRVCAQAYFSQAGVSQIPREGSQSIAAFTHMSAVAQDVIQGTAVVFSTGTTAVQVLTGNTASPAEAATLSSLVNIITGVISDGNLDNLPPIGNPDITWAPSNIQNAVNAVTAKKATLINDTINYINVKFAHTYVVGLNTATIGHGTNSTLYFGDTAVFPLQSSSVEQLSLQLSGSTSTWDSRKVDPIGAMGGSLVDGGVISDRSPIQSFVYDAYTQLNQGGVGMKITNNGYAQLVSVFTIFCSVGVQCDNGGIASITNSNCNFGDLSLVAKGYGKRSFSGTVFNPPYRSYPFSPNLTGNPDPNALDQYYPTGFWPQNGRVEVFVPDLANRPHIGQVMEVIPPETVFVSTGTGDTYVQFGTWTTYLNEQRLPGFLNAQPSTSTLVKGTIVLEGISNADIAIGNSVYIRDQFGSFFDPFVYKHDEFGLPILDAGGNTSTNAAYGIPYAAPGTVVTDVGYNSITLNQALTSGASFPGNTNYFTLYFCGNSYYTVQTSSVANSPYKPGTNILSANVDLNYQGPTTDQIADHIASINYLKTLVDKVISNIPITPSTVADPLYAEIPLTNQYISNAVAGGQGAQTFIDLRFDEMINIIGALNINAAQSVVPSSAVTQSGTIPAGAGSAVTLIKNNIDFLSNEIYAFILNNTSINLNASKYQYTKCRRDVGLILQQIIYDLETGGNYNSVYSGLSYWARPGTHHIVELGEAVNRTDLFPDGCIVNFYQRSYISASGYLFEYVGAGSNYGVLPQVGRADPVQSKETVQLDSGKVFFTSTDQNGDFRIGPGLVISQATGVLSGRTFTQSLFANMTPFILAIEG